MGLLDSRESSHPHANWTSIPDALPVLLLLHVDVWRQADWVGMCVGVGQVSADAQLRRHGDLQSSVWDSVFAGL